MRTVVMERNEYTVSFEASGDHTIIHCDVHSYNREIKKQLQADLSLLLSLRQSPLIAVHMNSKKHFKFLKMMGFELLTYAECSDHIKRDIYIIDNI